MPGQRVSHLLIVPCLGHPHNRNQRQRGQEVQQKARPEGRGRTGPWVRRPLLLNYSMRERSPRGTGVSEPLLPLFFAWG